MKFLLILLCLTTSLPLLAEGLKKVNFENETSDKKSSVSEEGPSLSAADKQKLMQDLEVIKKKQAEMAKTLEELEKDQ